MKKFSLPLLQQIYFSCSTTSIQAALLGCDEKTEATARTFAGLLQQGAIKAKGAADL